MLRNFMKGNYGGYTSQEAVAELTGDGFDEALVLRALAQVTRGMTPLQVLRVGHVRQARALLREWTDFQDMREAGLLGSPERLRR